jgi:hypothetical protein
MNGKRGGNRCNAVNGELLVMQNLPVCRIDNAKSPVGRATMGDCMTPQNEGTSTRSVAC